MRDAPVIERNHPSFSKPSASGGHPARDQLQKLVDQGFARVVRSRREAEAELGGKCFPAPLGDVVKLLPDGEEKHRLIQDLRRNLINDRVLLPERAVLPRFVDHAVDVALASGKGECETFIMDYENAFMAVPSDPREDRYNCCLLEVGHPMRRTRPPVHPNEPVEGSFLIWRVLGIGGKAFPLLYARVA